jgi:hypothetical protein
MRVLTCFPFPASVASLLLSLGLLGAGAARASQATDLLKMLPGLIDQASALGQPPDRPGAAPAPVKVPGLGVTLPGASSAAATAPQDSAFKPAYIVEHWRNHPDGGPPENTPSGQARGHVPARPGFGSSAAMMREPGAAEMKRKLEQLFARLLANPALRDIRGSSLDGGIALGSRRGGGAATTSMGGWAGLLAYPIKLDDPRTRQMPDGTVHTPGEGASLNILVNDMNQAPQIIGTYNGLTLIRRGGNFGVLVLNTDRPLTIVRQTASGSREQINPDLLDPARAPADIQVLMVYVGAGTPGQNALSRGEVSPISGYGRLLAATFTTDWPALVRELR